MSPEAPRAPSSPQTGRRVATAFEVLGVFAWLLLVLREQYQIISLREYQFSLDVLFLVAVAGVLLARGVARYGRVVLYRAAFLVVATVIAVIAAEYAARVDFRNANSSGNLRDFTARRANGPVVHNNSLGYREREIPLKTPDHYRIAIVGDSFTWGQGIEDAQRYSNLVGRALGSRYEVFNFGRQGNNMPDHLRVLTQALTISPDFVLLQLYPNDFETRVMARPSPYPLLPGRIDGELQTSSMLYDLAGFQWVRLQELLGICESYDDYMSRNLRAPDAPNAQLAFGQLKEFFERTKAAGVATGAVFFPRLSSLGPNGKTYPFGYLHDRVRQLCADEKVPCLDLFPVYSTFQDPRTLWVNRLDDHPNPMASQRAAEEIEKTFGPVWKF